MGTTVTLVNENGVYTATVYETELTIEELVGNVFRPVLLAAGYHPNNVADILDLE